MIKFLPRFLGWFVVMGAARQWRGFRRLHQLLGTGRVKWRNKFGLRMALDPFDYIDSFIIKEGYYESEVFDALISRLHSPNAVVWDVGANLGIHSLTLAKLNPGLTVVCFEPNPCLVEILRWQIKDNRLKGVSVASVALSNREESSHLHIYPGNAGMSSLTDWSGSSACTMPVQLVRADKLVDSCFVPMPNLIKLDVEGSELAVLQGLGSMIFRSDLRAIVFEDGSDLDSPVKIFLRQSGFAISKPLKRQQSTSHNLENYVATRK